MSRRSWPLSFDHRVSCVDDTLLERSYFTWSYVFMTVDRLSRAGTLPLTTKGDSIYRLYVAEDLGQRACWFAQVSQNM